MGMSNGIINTKTGKLIKADAEKIKNLSVNELSEWRIKWNESITIGERKAVGREFRDKYGLTDAETINLLDGHF
jgi:hypothetical protein